MSNGRSKGGKGKKAGGLSVGAILIAVAAWALNHYDIIDLGGSESGAKSGSGTATASRDSGNADRSGDTTTPPRKATKTPPKTRGDDRNDNAGGNGPSQSYARGTERVEQAFSDGESDLIVTVAGTVIKTLPDDNEGSRHQKFIIRLAGSSRTVLISHNIDLADRVPLREGDSVIIKGEYEWTERGGVLHWTHHDPKGWHENGWIEHEGRQYG